ncbi:MAG: hypothetical protein EOO12_12340, partial [Chitinophagaceae bacterium]
MKGILYLLLLLLTCCAQAQEDAWTPVRGLPSNEAYDLLRARKGHLWVAHNAGLSRYDGRSFVHYSNPLQNGRAVTDLCEDRQGRIWCHNFEGQIFYTDSNSLQLLGGYDFRQERYFPRIAISGDELVATSVRGFFTCRTADMQVRLYPMTETTSLTALPGGVLLFSPGYGFFWYRPGKRLRLLQSNLTIVERQDYVLQPEASGDTAQMLVNPAGLVYRLLVRNDSLIVLSRQQMPSYVNALTTDDDDWWIHTSTQSISGKGRRIEGRHLSNIVSDVQGHSFASSVKYGLLARYRSQAVPRPLPFLAAGDYVKSMYRLRHGTFLFGTQQGALYWVENGALRAQFRISPVNGPIEHIWKLSDSLYLLAGNLGCFRLDLQQRRVTTADFNMVVKDVATAGQRVVIATTTGVLPTDVGFLRQTDSLRALVPTGTNLRRCRSVCIGPDGLLYVSFNKGSFAWGARDSTELTYKGAPLYATRIRNFGNELLIATFTRGLFVKRPGGALEPLPVSASSQANTAPDIKIAGNTAWILYDDVIQQLGRDLRARELSDLPFRGSEVLDLLDDDGSLLAATTQGLFRLSPSGSAGPVTHTSIDYLRVNDSINASGRHQFSHRQNNLSISLSTPWFTSSDHLRYRYRLCPESNCSWLLSPEGQSSFTFINLSPGTYTFTAIAVNGNGTPVAPEVHYSFTIDPPWWGTWWARLLMVALLTTLFFLLGLYGQRRR